MRVFGLILGGVALLILTCVIFFNPVIFSILISLGDGGDETHFTLESVETTPAPSTEELPLSHGELRALQLEDPSSVKDSQPASNFSEMGMLNVADLQNLDQPPFVPGENLKLLPQDSHAVVSLPGVIQFMAQLSNPYPNQLWQVKVEAIVINADGSTREAISPRAIWLLPGQTIKLPIKFRAKEPRYHAGFTLFKAFVKDMNGKVLDQASIAFMLQKAVVP
jgi:hypothetical protein